MTWLNVNDEENSLPVPAFQCSFFTSMHHYIIHSSSFVSFLFYSNFHLPPHSSFPPSSSSNAQTWEKSFIFAFLQLSFFFLWIFLTPYGFNKSPWLLWFIVGGHQSLHWASLVWGQLCGHKFPKNATCRWPWAPPESTVRTPKAGSVFLWQKSKEPTNNAEHLHPAIT